MILDVLPSHVSGCKNPDANHISNDTQDTQGAIEDSYEPEEESVEENPCLRIGPGIRTVRNIHDSQQVTLILTGNHKSQMRNLT